MLKKQYLLFIFIALLGIVIYSLVGTEETKPAVKLNDSYLISIQNLRKEKNTYLKTKKDSPIENRANFDGLKYFEINPDFKLSAKLDILTTGQKINIAMTGGETEQYEAFANATFEFRDYRAMRRLQE